MVIPVYGWNKPLQGLQQVRDVLDRDEPDAFNQYLAVFVRQDIALTDDTLPRDLWMGRLEAVRHLTGSFTDDVSSQ